MLNDFALDFMMMGDRRIALVGLGLAIVGGLVAAVLFVSTARTARSGYFLGFCALLLAAALSRAMLIPAPGVIEKGYAGPLWLIWAAAQVACGFALWRLAETRSRDAHWHARAAPLAFIPLANVWLMAVPSHEAGETAGGRRPWGRAVIAVVAGVGLFVLAAMAREEISGRTQAALSGDGLPSLDAWVGILLQTQGLERTIKVLAAIDPPPAKAGGSNITAKVAAGDELRVTYVIDGEGYAFSDGFRRVFSKAECGSAADMLLLKAGATIHHSYFDKNGRAIGRQAITVEDCRL